MRDRFFLDTNVFVYSFDPASLAKKEVAYDLIRRALDTHEGIISLQVAQEFMNVALRKFAFPLKPPDAHAYLSKVLSPLCEVFPDFRLIERAIQLFAVHRLSFYDALIVSAAIEGRCRVLYSEDLRDGARIETVKVVNPFAS